MTKVLYTIISDKEKFIALVESDWGPRWRLDEVDVPYMYLLEAEAEGAIKKYGGVLKGTYRVVPYELVK